MTVVVYKDNTLATDRQLTVGTAIMEHSKLHIRHTETYSVAIGVTGCHAQCMELIEWYLKGRNPDTFPKGQDSDSWGRLVILHTSGELLVVESTPTPILMSTAEEEYYAWGSGMDTALGALYMKASATEAVMAANYHQADCGFGVSSISLNELRERRKKEYKEVT